MVSVVVVPEPVKVKIPPLVALHPNLLPVLATVIVYAPVPATVDAFVGTAE
jgi:hypothetical protein